MNYAFVRDLIKVVAIFAVIILFLGRARGEPACPLQGMTLDQVAQQMSHVARRHRLRDDDRVFLSAASLCIKQMADLQRRMSHR